MRQTGLEKKEESKDGKTYRDKHCRMDDEQSLDDNHSQIYRVPVRDNTP